MRTKCNDREFEMSGKRRRALKKLKSHVGKARLVRVSRDLPHDEGVDGFVLSVGKRWALLAATSSGGFLDGLVALRLKDVVKVEEDTSFESKFATRQPGWPVRLAAEPGLDRTSSVLWFFANRFPIFGFEQDSSREGLWIGELVGMDDRDLLMRDITPQATWREDGRWFTKKHISTVKGGDAYQRALLEITTGEPATAELWGSDDTTTSNLEG